MMTSNRRDAAGARVLRVLRVLGALGALLLVAVAACARPKGGATHPVVADFVPDLSGWRIEPNDNLVVTIWREPLFSVPAPGVTVAADGRVFLAGLGRVPVQGLTVDSLRSLLTVRYRDRFLDPQVEVLHFRPIVVLGGARNTASFPMPPWATVRELLARAQGTVNIGKNPSVTLISGRDSTEMRLPYDAPLSMVGVHPGDAVYVDDMNWLVRATPIVNQGLIVFTSLIGLVSIFR